MRDPTAVAAARRVPFLDLGPAHAGLKERILAELARLIDAGTFVNGPWVSEFEQAFAGSCGVAHAVGLSSGLDALRLGLLAAGIEPGDEVLVPAMTFVATFEAVAQAGGAPVPVDISERDYGMNPETAEAAIGPRTRALLPVHLYGQLADMASLRALARRHGLLIIEDACQAHGAERDGLRAGAAGDAAAFSFYPAKNLGALGDAGALVTGDAALAARVRALREHGQSLKYVHEVEGYTARLDALQAAVLHLKLPFLGEWNAQRRAAAAFYSAKLDGVGDLRLPPAPEGSSPAWHLYVVRTQAPDALGAFLGQQGIETGRHYPVPPHLSPAYARLGHRAGAFPAAERLAREALSLPLFPGIDEGQLHAVVDAVRQFFDHG